ncbi:hypothetical protein EBZ80_02250 [bacterium]|nr:hypothetical protein [bacterium]
MSQISLTGSLRTCKVDQGWASRIQSDRFENPELMVCPVWSGFDNTNRPVCIDSYYTKSPGCNSPLDRVDVENYLRPQYMEYINLDAEGFRYTSDRFAPEIVQGTSENFESCTNSNTNMSCYESGVRTIGMEQLPRITGNFNQSPNGAQIYPRCGSYPINVAMKQEAVVAQANQQNA